MYSYCFTCDTPFDSQGGLSVCCACRVPSPGGRRATRVPDNHLGRREVQISSLASARAMSNKEIAVQLGLTEGTVKVLMSRILRKCKVHSRAELAAQYWRGQLARMSLASDDLILEGLS